MNRDLMSHFGLQVQACQWLISQPHTTVAAIEVDWMGYGRVDALGVSVARAEASSRVSVVEVKVSLSDLRSDLKAKKMFRYEFYATHCYIAVPRSLVQAVTETMPKHWGILVCSGLRFLADGTPEAKIVVERAPTRLNTQPAGVVTRLVRSCGRSASWRAVRMSAHEILKKE